MVEVCYARYKEDVLANRGTSWGSMNQDQAHNLFYRRRKGGGLCVMNTDSSNNDPREIEPNGRCKRLGRIIDCPLAEYEGASTADDPVSESRDVTGLNLAGGQADNPVPLSPKTNDFTLDGW